MSIPDTLRHGSREGIFETYPALGFNYRMTDIQAAVGREQLKKLKEIVARRRQLVNRYNQYLTNLPGLELPYEPEWARSNWQSFSVRLPDSADQRSVMQAMLDAGKYFLRKQKRSTGISDKEIIKIAVKSLGLDDLYQFKPEEKIIEYAIAGETQRGLVDMSLEGFVEETASESAAPGGGSISAAAGAMGAALGTMVANLSSHKRGWDERWEEFSDWAEKGQALKDELLAMINSTA